MPRGRSTFNKRRKEQQRQQRQERRISLNGGLKKNAHRLFVTCALVNLFVSRRKLLAAA